MNYSILSRQDKEMVDKSSRKLMASRLKLHGESFSNHMYRIMYPELKKLALNDDEVCDAFARSFPGEIGEDAIRMYLAWLLER